MLLLPSHFYYYICFHSKNTFVGRVPSELCLLGATLAELSFGDNTDLSCYADCLTTVITLTSGSVPFGCPSFQDDGLCSIVAATNIATIYPRWSCDSTGFTETDPCDAIYGWNDTACDGGRVNVDSININTSSALSGT